MTRHLAHFNWGILRHDWTDPRVAEFTQNLERVNRIAARSKGYVWRMPDAQMEREQVALEREKKFPHRYASTLSVWETVEDLAAFTYQTLHGRFVDRRTLWFDPVDRPRYVLWHIAPGEIPSFAEAQRRLALLEADGAGPEAFDFAYARGKDRACPDTSPS